MIRKTGILMAIRVVGTGAPLSTINRGSHKKNIANKFDSTTNIRQKDQSVSTRRASNATAPPSEQRFHKLLRTSTCTFKQDLEEYLTSSPTQQPPVGILARFFPRLQDISNPFEYVCEEDVHCRAAVRYLLFHHDCNPVTLLSHDSPPTSSSSACLLLLYACANVGQLSLIGSSRWERTSGYNDGREEEEDLLLLDPNMSGRDTIRVLRWIGDTCSGGGKGSLTGLVYTNGKGSKRRFHIPTTHLFRALQAVVKCDFTDDVDIKWLVKQTIASKELESTFPRQSGTSKRIDLVGGRAHWTTLVYSPQTRSVVGTAPTEDKNGEDCANVASVLHLCASFDQVSLDILRWHADGKTQQLRDFVRMVCELKSSINREMDEVGVHEIQTLFLLGVLGAMAVDGSRSACPENQGDKNIPLAAISLREVFISPSPSPSSPLIYWGELLQDHILTNSRMLLSPSQMGRFVTALLKPTRPIPSGRHIVNKLQSRLNAEYAIYMELLANVDPVAFVQEYGALHPSVVLCPTGAGAVVKALVLQYVLTGPASLSKLKVSTQAIVSQLAPKDGFLYFGALSIEADAGIDVAGGHGEKTPRELETAFGHLSPILSLQDGTLSKWEGADETVVGGQVSVSSDSAATILLGRRHRSVTTVGLSRLAVSGVLPLITATNLPRPGFNVSLWKLDVAKILLKFRTDVFVNTSNSCAGAGVAARISFTSPSIDEQLVVLSKPSGMASSLYCPQHSIRTNKAGGENFTDTSNIVSSLLGPLHADVYARTSDNESRVQRPVRVFNELGLLNRLDAHTTGVMLAVVPCVPKTNNSSSSAVINDTIDIAKYISTCANVSHTLEKKYLALVHHHSIRPKSTPRNLKGTLEWLLPMGVLNTHVGTVVSTPPSNTTATTGSLSGIDNTTPNSSSTRSLYQGPLLESTRTLNASTRYRILRSYPTSRSYLIELTLTSGRRHQIRQHMANVGFPLYGDVMYGGIRDPALIQRTALHATSITIPLQATKNGTATVLEHTIEAGDTVEGVSTQRVRVTRALDGKAVTVGVALPADMLALVTKLESKEQRK